jgi:hypothetical protein
VDAAAVVGAYDFRPFDTVADIGGGRGRLLRAVLDAVPDVAGILFELPQVVASLGDPHPRITVVAGDFFVDALPAADAYVLGEVLRGRPDAECVAILSAVRRAARRDATVLVVDGERAPAQLAALLARTGFATRRVVSTAGALRIVEACADR